MAIPSKFTESLDAFFVNCPLADAAYPSTGGTVFLQFNDEYKMPEPLAIRYDTKMPTALVRESDGLAKGQTIDIRGVNYRVIGVHPTGAGTANVVLSKNVAHGN